MLWGAAGEFGEYVGTVDWSHYVIAEWCCRSHQGVFHNKIKKCCDSQNSQRCEVEDNHPTLGAIYEKPSQLLM